MPIITNKPLRDDFPSLATLIEWWNLGVPGTSTPSTKNLKTGSDSTLNFQSGANQHSNHAEGPCLDTRTGDGYNRAHVATSAPCGNTWTFLFSWISEAATPNPSQFLFSLRNDSFAANQRDIITLISNVSGETALRVKDKSGLYSFPDTLGWVSGNNTTRQTLAIIRQATSMTMVHSSAPSSPVTVAAAALSGPYTPGRLMLNHDIEGGGTSQSWNAANFIAARWDSAVALADVQALAANTNSAYPPDAPVYATKLRMTGFRPGVATEGTAGAPLGGFMGSVRTVDGNGRAGELVYEFGFSGNTVGAQAFLATLHSDGSGIFEVPLPQGSTVTPGQQFIVQAISGTDTTGYFFEPRVAVAV